MRPGTPGFIGDRLKAAREARGIMTAAGLAEMVGVTRAAISQYERGDQSPSPTILAAMSEVLNLPTHHFLHPGCVSPEPIFFRSLSTATKAMRRRAERRYEWLREICGFLQSQVRFPQVDFPILEVPNDPNQISFDQIETAATGARRHWGLGDGPISNITWLLENKGAVVVRADLDSNELDAFSQWPVDADRPFIILGTNKGRTTRSRFNAMHEVAHMVLHRNVAPEAFETPATFRLMELQAHRFAAAFLLPASTFRREVHFLSLDAFKPLKLRWRTSISTMIHRLEDLGAVAPLDSKRLWVTLSRRQWRQHEPYDDTIEIEAPRFLRRCFELLLSNRVVGAADLPVRLRLNARDIEELANLPAGLLGAVGSVEEVSEPEPTVLRFPVPPEIG